MSDTLGSILRLCFGRMNTGCWIQYGDLDYETGNNLAVYPRKQMFTTNRNKT